MWRGTIGVFLAVMVACVLTAGGHLYSPDEETMFRTTESIATRGRLGITPIPEGPNRGFAARMGADGLFYAQYGVGNSLFAVPLYYAGALVSRFVDPARAHQTLDFATVDYLPLDASGSALLLRFAVSFFGAFVAAATAALLWRFTFRLWGSRRAAWLTALAYALGTMALPHARTFFSEPLATFFVLLTFYWLGTATRFTARTALGAGIAYALALLTRLDSAFVFPAVALLWCLRLARDSRGEALQMDAGEFFRALFSPRAIGLALLFGLPLLAFAGFQLWQNAAHFGSPFASGYSSRPEGIKFTTPLHAGLYGFLGSIGKSVFLFSPAVIIGLAGFGAFWRRRPFVAIPTAVAALLVLTIHARWQNWAGGWCWGPRHVFMLHAFVMLGAGAWLADWTRAKGAFYAVICGLGIAAQVYGCSQNFIDYYILYYRTTETPPQAYVLFSGEDTSPNKIPAPINDSIYVPQNSQWYCYGEMWDLGYTDNLWLRLARRAKGTERPLDGVPQGL